MRIHAYCSDILGIEYRMNRTETFKSKRDSGSKRRHENEDAVNAVKKQKTKSAEADSLNKSVRQGVRATSQNVIVQSNDGGNTYEITAHEENDDVCELIFLVASFNMHDQ